MTEPEHIVIYRSTDREGATFALKPGSRERIKSKLGTTVHLRSRVFIAHETEAEYNAMRTDLGPQIVQLLTGLTMQRLEELGLGSVVFRDPVTDADIPQLAA